MNENDVIKKIQNTANLLYQNKEREGITATSELLILLQNILQNLTEEQIANGGQFAVLMMKELIEAHRNQDVLGIADCLIEKSILFVQFAYRENNKEN